jgi:hypothetical protein
MAAPAKAKTKPGAKWVEAPLESVFEELVEIMMRHAPPFRTDIACMSGGKKSFQLTVPKSVVVPGAYGGKPVDLQMAAAILQKDFVGFYLMCVYMNNAVKKKLSPALLKLLKGKACFHLKYLDDGLRKDIEAALTLGEKSYQERGWM